MAKQSIHPLGRGPLRWSEEAMRARLVRYEELAPCFNAFIDTRTPGSERKENFTIIGPGVSENPAQHVHIREPHGFNIGGARQPPHCVNSQHSHETAEVFLVHSGRWSFNFGERGDALRVEAGPGTVVSFPTRMFRGFTNIGEDVGFLWSVLGGDDPGRVTWAPYVFDMARDYGLMLLEDGRLIDTVKGEAPPPGLRPMPVTTAAQAALLYVPNAEEAEALLVRPGREEALAQGPLGALPGVREAALIGPANAREDLAAAPLSWRHGFHLRRIDLATGATVPRHLRSEAEVLFLHKGDVDISWTDGLLEMRPGDTLTLPQDLPRAWRSREGATLFAVRGGDAPAAPEFVG